MTTFERVKETAKKQGLSLTDTSIKAGMGEKAIYKWKYNEPSASRLQAVAGVLHVSVDYLLGNTDDPSPKAAAGSNELTENQKLIAYSIDPDVSDEEREHIISLVKEAMKFRRRL
ncbi:helix-turn-helix domain-containing protein [Lacticaseibacillus mingshuiensis]|uniref:helix-turn-helix domain-containing protein n=1 Tax=Lacticaseibacillus mingshuiensis TaxID=2799574 RepID=UPI001943648E|nr:helix-turn-helix transcriptional regulator [Lacticaseibacillus mingshuiensis]